MRLGIIGTGGMAQRMLATLSHRPQIKVTAIASTSPARAASLAQGVGATPCTYTEIAVRPDVDAVYVANRNADHATAALAAIAAGKPVLVEKPLGKTKEEADRVTVAAKIAGVLLVENLWTLTLPATAALFGDTAKGPRLLQMDFGYPVTRDTHPGLFAPDAGVLRDRAGYGFALALRLFGPVADLSCSLRVDGDCDVAAMIALRHASGDLSTITVAFDALLCNQITLSGPNGLITLTPSTGAERATTQTTPPPGPQGRPSRLKSLPALRALNRWRKVLRGQTHSYGADPYLPMIDHFTTLIRDGKTESPLVPLSLSADVQDLITRARIAGGLR
ncbi:MAG: Gfo/Idh/MocA family protein [Paracoccaceae bacterium]